MSAKLPSVGRDAATPDARAVRRAFGRAAATYDKAAVLQREVGARLLARLDPIRLAPHSILDAGCATGDLCVALRARFPDARIVGLDLALPMLVRARTKSEPQRSLLRRLVAPLAGGAGAAATVYACADARALPFAAGRFGLVASSLLLQWIDDIPLAIAEFARVLEVGGLVAFSTFGPDTLQELRAAFAGIDGFPHLSRFADMHDLGDMLVAAGFADPVVEREVLTLTYAEPEAMLRDLKAIGATNAGLGRSRGLLGRGRYARVLAALDATRRDGRIPATFEVVYGHAWKVPRTKTAEGHAIVRFERAKAT